MARVKVKGVFWCVVCGDVKTERLESDDLGPQCPDCYSGKIADAKVIRREGDNGEIKING